METLALFDFGEASMLMLSPSSTLSLSFFVTRFEVEALGLRRPPFLD